MNGDTDMAGTKKNVTVVGDAESHLMDFIAPVLDALPRPNSDNGHDLPTDGSLKFIYGAMLQLWMEQTYGQLTIRDKRTGAITSIPNAKTRFENSEEQFRKLQAKHSGNDEALVSDVDYDRITGWLRVNEARFICNRRHIDALTAVYVQVAGHPFTWVPRVPTQVETKVVSAAEKKAKLAAHSKLMASRNQTLCDAGIEPIAAVA
jgi:hypothetical protein